MAFAARGPSNQSGDSCLDRQGSTLFAFGLAGAGN
jgi:hypothetical protein